MVHNPVYTFSGKVSKESYDPSTGITSIERIEDPEFGISSVNYECIRCGFKVRGGSWKLPLSSEGHKIGSIVFRAHDGVLNFCTSIVPYDSFPHFDFTEEMERLEPICPDCHSFRRTERIGVGGWGNAQSPIDFLYPFQTLKLQYAKRYKVYYCKKCDKYTEEKEWEAWL